MTFDSRIGESGLVQGGAVLPLPGERRWNRSGKKKDLEGQRKAMSTIRPDSLAAWGKKEGPAG